MIQINNFGAYLGMGMMAITVAVLWFLADKDEKHSKKSKHQHHRK